MKCEHPRCRNDSGDCEGSCKKLDEQEEIVQLPPEVVECIDAYARYYAEHHKLGMSIRDDMKYIASVAIRFSANSTPREQLSAAPPLPVAPAVGAEQPARVESDATVPECGTLDYKVLWERDSASLGKCLQEIHNLRAVKEDQRAIIATLERELAEATQQGYIAGVAAERGAERAARSATGSLPHPQHLFDMIHARLQRNEVETDAALARKICNDITAAAPRSTSGTLTLELADELFGSFLRSLSGGGYYCVHCDEPIEPDDWINGIHRADCIVEKARAYLKIHKPSAVVSASGERIECDRIDGLCPHPDGCAATGKRCRGE